MSVSHNLITAAAVEEIEKWRCKKMNNNGEGEYQEHQHEHNSDLVSMMSSGSGSSLISPQQQQKTPTEGWSLNQRLSENNHEEQKTPQKINSSASNDQHHPRIFRTFFVRLAEESPKRNNYDEFSDSSTYGSLNCCETDICRDSSDTESNSSFTSGEIGATIKVVEYEVASASNSEDLFTNDSSSGTDDFILAAVARAICNTSKCSSEFADTEEDSSETDTTYDSEFSLADYWVCVKCKNKQNNPMFRYCEKCYQIRKTHFPPRPRLRKSRITTKKQKNSPNFVSLRQSATTSEMIDSLAMRNQQDNKNISNSSKPSASASSSSSSSSSSSNTTLDTLSNRNSGRLAIKRSRAQFPDENSSSDDDNNARHLSKNILNISESKEIPFSKYLSFSITSNQKFNENGVNSQNMKLTAKRKLPKAPSKYKPFSKRKCFEPNSMSSGSEIETDTCLSQPICVNSQQSTQKDSGFSSAPSSQDRKSSSDHQVEEDDEECGSICGDKNAVNSDDTVCDELSECDVAEISMSHDKNLIPSTLKFDLNSQDNSLGRHTSDITMQTSTESNAISTLVQSVSECSDAYTNVKQCSSISEFPEMLTIKEKLRSQQPGFNDKKQNPICDYPNYGSCMTCLVEPKNGVFVHSRFLHLCCCYKCAVKIWNKNKKCPICNCAVKNVMKLFVH